MHLRGTNVRVIIYGNLSPNSLEGSYGQAFEQLGATVTIIDRQSAKSHLTVWLQNRLLHRLTINSLLLRRLGSTKWNNYIQNYVKNAKPDFFLIVGGQFIMPETIQRIREFGIKVYILFTDNPFPVNPNCRPEVLPSALACDAYFIWSRLLVHRLKSMGVKQVEYLPFGWDPDVFPYSPPDNRYDYDVTFIGGWDRERENFLEQLAKNYDLKVWGPPYWKTHSKINSPLRRSWQGRALYGRDAAFVLRRSRIALNLLRRQNLPDGHNMRTFELPGCGSFGLSTHSPGATEIFPGDYAGAYFTTPDSCAKQIDYFLPKDSLRAEITSVAHTIVATQHRYIDRAKRILETHFEIAN